MNQSDLDFKANASGKERYYSSLIRALKSEDAVDTKGYSRIIKEYMLGVTNKISDWLDHCRTDGRAKHAMAFKMLDNLPPAVIAYISFITILSKIQTPVKKTSLCFALGKRINDEILYRHFKKIDRESFDHVSRLSARRSGFVYRRYTFNHYIKENNLFVDLIFGTDSQVACGLLLLEFINQSTDILQNRNHFTKSGNKTTTHIYIEASNSFTSWLERYNKYHCVQKPYFEPRVEVAPEWGALKTIFTGTELPALPFIKESRVVKLNQELNSDLTEVYSSVNTIQHTKWKINKDVLDIANIAFSGNWVVSNINGNKLLDLPNKPDDIETNLEARVKWRKEAAKTHAKNVPLKSKILQSSETLSVANKFLNEDAIYFNYQLDFRGRVYPINPFLNPQGTDLAKGLLTFREGMPLKNDDDVKWLKMHGANTFGVDKVSFKDRFDWVDSNKDLISSIASDPIENKQWVEADSPFQFLAFCFEYSKFQREGFGFISSLPIGIDGSNNGLQILSLLSRDIVGGKATNCIQLDTPADIYQDVADELLLSLMESNSELDNFWINFGITRKTTKRPVMTVPYGLTLYSCKNYIIDWFIDESMSRKLDFQHKEVITYCNYLGVKMWAAIKKCIGGAISVMDWLQTSSHKLAKLGKETVWKTPTGLFISQRYNQLKLKRQAVYLYKKQLRTSYLQEGTKIDVKSQKLGISPNFVHSLDAACLQRTINYANNFGIKSFAVVHDSFGSVAANITELAGCVRHAYYTVFKDDQLENFKTYNTDIDFDPHPNFGTLDAKSILDSDYFFA